MVGDYWHQASEWGPLHFRVPCCKSVSGLWACATVEDKFLCLNFSDAAGLALMLVFMAAMRALHKRPPVSDKGAMTIWKALDYPNL